MSKKKIVRKTSPKIVEAEKVAPVATKASKPDLRVGSLEEAERHLKERYAHLDSLTFCVLENGHVYYGENVHLGAKIAKKNGLKYFDVKH